MDIFQIFSYEEWRGPAFELFGTAHLVGMGLFVLYNALVIIFRKRIGPRLDRALRYSMAAILVINECGWHIWNAYHGKWSVQETLPLHVCSVFVWTCAYMLVTSNYRIFEFAFLLGIPAALQAFVTPDAGQFGFPHLRFFQVLLSHGFIISSAIYMASVKGYRPTWGSVKRVFIFANLYAVIVFFLNFALGSNYMFLAHKISTASLLDVLPPWPYYLAIIEALGMFCVFLLYSPYAIMDWISARKHRS
jgi:hypothetical integral membrane protein (TIGR02206 family)